MECRIYDEEQCGSSLAFLHSPLSTPSSWLMRENFGSCQITLFVLRISVFLLAPEPMEYKAHPNVGGLATRLLGRRLARPLSDLSASPSRSLNDRSNKAAPLTTAIRIYL